jgi:O-antigen ligase
MPSLMPFRKPIAISGFSPVWVLAGIFFLAPALGVPGEWVLQDTLKSAVVALGIFLAVAVFFWQRRDHSTPVLWHGMLLLPLVLMVYSMGSMGWSHTYLAAVEAVRWLVLGLLMWLALNVITRENLPLVATGVHGGAVVASAWVALQFWFDLQWFPQAAMPASTFANRNFFAEYAVGALPFSVMWLVGRPSCRLLPAQALTVVLVFLAVLMSGTRSAIVTLLVVTPVLVFVMWRYRRLLPAWRWGRATVWRVCAVALFGLVGLGSLPSGNPTIQAERFGASALERSLFRAGSVTKSEEYTTGSFSVRALLWRSTARMVMDKPWTGVGAGAWEVHIPLYQGVNNSVETDFYAHNEYVQLLGEYGLPVGGGFLAVLFAYVLIAAGKTWGLGVQEGEEVGAAQDPVYEAPWRAIVLTSLLALMLVSNAGFPWRLGATGALLTLCLGILCASDARLGLQEVWASKSLKVSPVRSQWLAVASVAALAFAMYITQQAMLAERNIMGAIHLSNKALRDGTPVPSELMVRLQQGVAINPHYRKLTTRAADQLARLREYEAALWALETVVASRPHVADIWANLVLLNHHFGKLDRARAALAQLHRLQPDAPRTVAMQSLLDAATTHPAQ